MKIFWTKFAKREIRNIFDYYKLKASPNIAKKLITGMIEQTNF